MVDKDEVLSIVKRKGPILPVQIRREIDGADTIRIGAALSELAKEEKLKISNSKIGGSPVYYVEEQKKKLQDLREHLNDKQQRAFDMLKQKKVLRDQDQEPVIRASLRDIKDFAKPLEVKTDEGKEIYWKWYLASNEEVKEIIEEDVGKKEKKVQKQQGREKQQTLQQEQETEEEKEKEEEKPAEPEEEPGYEREPTDDDFLKKVRKFFDDNDIEILEENSVRRGSDLEFVVKVPTPVGKQKYFCKARGKKKCNDGDLSSAYIKGQTKRLPVLFIYTGDITKKAMEMMDEEFKGMVIKKL